MTRDEAEQKLMAGTASTCTVAFMRDFIDSAVALGMLKIDEPKGPNQKAVDAMFERCERGMITPRHAMDAIADAGLKIVEK